MNKITIVGRLTKDVELANTTSGVAYVKFNLASKGNTKDADGNVLTDFFNCMAWRVQAETLAKFSKKGDLICVSGSMTCKDYEDKSGTKQRFWECNVDSFEFLASKGDKPQENKDTDLQPIDDDDNSLPF